MPDDFEELLTGYLERHPGITREQAEVRVRRNSETKERLQYRFRQQPVGDSEVSDSEVSDPGPAGEHWDAPLPQLKPEPPPKTEYEIKEERVMGWVREALLQLTANLLRITRTGTGGEPYAILPQMTFFINAVMEYEKEIGHPPYLGNILFVRKERDDDWERFGNAYMMEMEARDEIIDGALQVVASRLLGSKSIERFGKREMDQGINYLERARLEFRRELNTPHRKK